VSSSDCTTLHLCFQLWGREATGQKTSQRSIKLNRTETTSIRADKWDLEDLELQDTLDAVSQVFPSTEVVSKLPQIQAKFSLKIKQVSYPVS